MQVREINKQELHVLKDDGSIIAGVNIGYYRPWIYPLCTPAGVNILREFPPDHGFHNGAFFGHYPLVANGLTHNFWGAPPFRSESDEIAVWVGRLSSRLASVKVHENNVTLILDCAWISHEGDTIVDEQRTFSIETSFEQTRLHTKSTLLNTSKQLVSFNKSKCGGHAYRLSAQAFAFEDCIVTTSDNEIGIERAHGTCAEHDKKITISSGKTTLELGASPDCFYFVRSYGLVCANPFLELQKKLHANESYTFYSKLVIS